MEVTSQPITYAEFWRGALSPCAGDSLEHALRGDTDRVMGDAGFVSGVATSLLQALEFIHSTGWLHCDIKPANFLFAKDDTSHTGRVSLGEPCMLEETGGFRLVGVFTASATVCTMGGLLRVS